MSLINDDYDGNAVQVLRDNIDNESFVIGPHVSDSLEFRSYMCVSRWFGTRAVTMEVKEEVTALLERVLVMNRNEFGSKNWTAHQVRFGEMQGLQAGSALMFDRCNIDWSDKKHSREPEYTMRDHPCPEEYVKYLLKEDELIPDSIDLI
mmetsp:Transcript_3338/g.6269  ORF Transcript_3338/g.6269 Transcript_3338/m.6269 type:complete len:149 (+) Transcript_3338:1-447(+)